MISRRLLVNLIVFFAVSVGLVLYGVVNLLGDPLQAPTAISAVFPNASSLYPNFAVQLDGVDVGSVTSVTLTKGGARVAMAIHHGVKVPSDVVASIDIANDLGEQVVELTPRPGTSAHDPPLRSGAVVPVAAGSIPVSIGKVVKRAVTLLDAIPPGKLNSLLGTLATALTGQATNLRTFISASTAFSREFLHYQHQFTQLLANAPPLLNALTAVGPQLRSSLANTEALVAALAADRGQLAPFFGRSSQLLDLLDGLVGSESPNLGCALHDFSQLAANLSQPQNLSNLSRALADSHYFFGAIYNAIQPGPSKTLSTAVPGTDSQLFARTRLLLPPRQPSAETYPTPHSLSPIQPGAGCSTPLGQGVGPATQPGFSPAAGGQLVPPSQSESWVHG